MKTNYNDYLKRNIANNKFIAILCLPIFIFSKIIPKSKKVKIFGSMNGYDITDNSKYLFINEYKQGYYFITKNKTKLKTPIINDIYPIYYLSLKGLILQLIASEAYYTHSVFDFFSPLIMGAKVIALWHGVPGKKINTALIEQKKYLKKVHLFLYTYIFPYKYYAYCNEVWCPNNALLTTYKECFIIGNPKIIIHKQPRNIYAKNMEANKNIILYAPTYRKNKSIYDIMKSLYFFNNETIDILNQNNIKIIIRPHPIDLKFLLNSNLPDCYELDCTGDVYDSIRSYGLLITDYSSLYYDAIELGIKTEFLQNDIDEYDYDNGLFDSFRNIIISNSTNNIVNVIKKYIQ